MNFSKLFFLGVFLVCYVHSKRSETEWSVPPYEPTVDETHDNQEPIGTASVNRVDKGTTGAEVQNQEFAPPEEQKPNKKSKHFGYNSESKINKNNKKYTSAEPGSENIYNKEFKNISHKKGKGYNRKNNFEQQIIQENQGTEFALDQQLPTESINMRSSKVTGLAPSVRVERSVKVESEPIAEEQPQEVKPQKQEKNRKYDKKSGKYGKQYNKSKNGSKRQKRNSGYFGFWA